MLRHQGRYNSRQHNTRQPETEKHSMSNHNQRHHNTPYYKRTAPQIRRHAYNQPDYRCPHCHMTLTEMRAARPNNIAGWDAGHIVDGDETYGLRAECSYCNWANGARKRNQTKPVTSRNWTQKHRGQD